MVVLAMPSPGGNGSTRSSEAGGLDVRSHEGRSWLIELRGELDLSNAHVLNQELHLAGLSDAQEIVVDLSRLGFMDSSGLHLLLRAFDREPKRLRLVPAPPAVQSIFRLTGMEKHLPFQAVEA